MRKQKMTALLLGLLLLLALPAFAGCGASDEEAEDARDAVSEETEEEADSNEYGVSLHEFEATDFDGNVFTREDLADADVTVMNLWATWSGDCVNQMPELAVLENQLPEGVTLVTYCDDGTDQTETAKQILESAGFTGTALYGGTGDFNALLKSAEGLPTTIFLDADGDQICEPITGNPDDPGEAYRKKINQALNKVGGTPIGP